ncbi:MAG: hypothetical protein ACRER3_00340 [Pseudomonas fluorescens]
MATLEDLLTQVWNPDIRPLANEAWRCYNAGAIRTSITATWTAVTADIISKLVHLADDGDANAIVFRNELAAAQSQGLQPEGVHAMQSIEAKLLAKAVKFELIDSIDQRELERIREDRNLCAHPSLRRFSEIYAPHPEAARFHLVMALTTLLTHPPTQGGKVLEAFQEYTCDPSFVPALGHIQKTFFDRVRVATRTNIAKLAAKHALRELDPDGRMAAIEYADRAAVVLSAFAERDRELVREAMTSQREQFQKLEGEMQLRALVRLGDQDYFWDIVDEALIERLEQLLETSLTAASGAPLRADVAAQLAMVGGRYARDQLPILEEKFAALSEQRQMEAVAARPAAYFVSTVLNSIAEAGTYRDGEQAGQLLIQHAPFLTVSTLQSALTSWVNNSQCLEAAQMPDLAARLFRATAHLGAARAAPFKDFLEAIHSRISGDDSYGSFYRYPALETALRAANYLP